MQRVRDLATEAGARGEDAGVDIRALRAASDLDTGALNSALAFLVDEALLTAAMS